jgi:hypothetical protein
MAFGGCPSSLTRAVHTAPEPPQPRASGSHRSPSNARATTASRIPPPPSWRAINSESEAVLTRDAPPHAPRPASPHCQPLRLPIPLVVRSFISPITIHDDAVITIQRVRQHQGGLATGRRCVRSGRGHPRSAGSRSPAWLRLTRPRQAAGADTRIGIFSGFSQVRP